MNVLIILFFVGALIVALAMEFVKLSGNKKPIVWQSIAFVLTAIINVSLYFGVKNDFSAWILPFMVIVGYVLQLVINQYGAKKILLIIVNKYLKKHGYTNVEKN